MNRPRSITPGGVVDLGLHVFRILMVKVIEGKYALASQG
jgi:hypothetical protein